MSRQILPVTAASTRRFAATESGGKGMSLYTMSAAGWNVPEWQVLGSSFFLGFLEQTGRGTLVEQELQKLRNAENASAVSSAISEHLLHAELPEEIAAQIKSSYETISQNNSTPLAVRSSAKGEDGALHSFAGQHDTFLNISDWSACEAAIKKCWASLYSERALGYRHENYLLDTPFEMAVILQRMIEPKYAGVLFTADPASSSADKMVVSHVKGLADALVSGEVSGSTTWFDASSGSVLEEEVEADAGTLPESAGKDLVALGTAAVAYFHRPLDIEWAIADDTLYVLQSRPITSTVSGIGYRNLWDNSNIVESYGGITLPLSFSYALYNYQSVYKQFCQVLLIPDRIINEMSPTLNNMLGSIEGRVYYNLYNWYKLVSLLPFFGSNSSFMETMMGVRESIPEDLKARLLPHPSLQGAKGLWRRFLSGLALTAYHFRIDSMVNRFQTDFGKQFEYFYGIETEQLRFDELYELYVELEQKVLANWHLPIINDFLCMIHFGLSKALVKRFLCEDEQLHNALVAGDHDVESTLPAKELLRLSKVVSQSETLRHLFEEYNDEELLEALQHSQEEAFLKEIEHYLDRFGFRCPNEMKMEAKDLFEMPEYIFACIRNQIDRPESDNASLYEEQKKQATAQVDSLPFLKQNALEWSVHHARKAVRNRESLRLNRSRAYGIARRLLKAMGRELQREGLLHAATDVHYLTLDELRGVHNGTLPAACLNAIATARAAEYETFEHTDPPDRFETFGAVYSSEKVESLTAAADLPEDVDLKGIACSPGVVEGEVKVLHSCDEGVALNGEILVAKRTDPGWVPLYPGISGLLVEHGSLLSHSAIVAREMGIPSIVKIPGLLKTLKSGDRVRIDGKQGTISILSSTEN